MSKWVFRDGRGQGQGQVGVEMWVAGLSETSRRQCFSAESAPKQLSSPVPHHMGNRAAQGMTCFANQTGATFLVRQVLMTEVERIREVGQGSSEASGD